MKQLEELRRLVLKHKGRELLNGDLIEVTLGTNVGIPITVVLSFYDYPGWLKCVQTLANLKCRAIGQEEVWAEGILDITFVRAVVDDR